MSYTQETRRLSLTTPLGENVLLIQAISGYEALSQLYSYRIDAFALRSVYVDFGQLLGKTAAVAVSLTQGETRYIHGIIHRAGRGESGESTEGTTAYYLEIAPPIWTLTKRIRSRIFQQQTVPDILRVLLGAIQTKYQILGTFEPREYCVQYHESDFHFFSRLCEEEGIYYYFEHTQAGCTLVLANTPQSHPVLPYLPVIRRRTQSQEDTEVILTWEKSQSIRSGRMTLWDHHPQLPGRHLEAIQTMQPTVTVGRETNKLDIGPELEQYHFPGGYAERFDGVSSSGGAQDASLQKIFQDNVRTAGIRMQQETADAMVFQATTDFAGVMHGYRFSLAEHPTDDGTFVITSAQIHIPQAGGYTAGEGGLDAAIEISFTAIPFEIPYRPPQFTPKPAIYGAQTAYVTGPAGEEIYVDKFGRVKVAFHWDRNASGHATSCWIRVGQGVAGNQWGTFWTPRVGQEVIVIFLEGDPDRPLITGSVYHPGCMPPYALPDHKTRSTIKTNSTVGGGGFNEIRFEDKKGQEQVFHHAEKDLDVRVKNDHSEIVQNNRHLIVVKDNLEEVRGNRHVTIHGDRASEIQSSDSLTIGGDQDVSIANKFALDAGQEIHLKTGGKIVLEAGQEISLKVGGSFIKVTRSAIRISTPSLSMNSGGSAGSGSGAAPDKPQLPREAVNDRAGSKTAPQTRSLQQPGPQAIAFQRASLAGAPFCEICPQP